MRKLKDEIMAKNEQIALLERQIADSLISSHNKMDTVELSQASLAPSHCDCSFPFSRSPNLCSLFF